MDYFDAYCVIGRKPRSDGRARWSLQHLQDELDHCSISGALVASQAQWVGHTHTANLKLFDDLAEHPHLHPIWELCPSTMGDFPTPAEFLRQMESAGVRAVRLSPKSLGFNASSDDMRTLLRELAERRVLTIVEVLGQMQPAEVDQLIRENSDLPLLLTGVLWSFQRHAASWLRANRNVHIAFDRFQSNRFIEWMYREGMIGQAVYASNAPAMSAGAHRAYIDWAEIPDDAKAMAAGGNLVRLLHGTEPGRSHVNPNEDSLMTAARQGQPLPCLTVDMHGHILEDGQDSAGTYVMLEGGATPVRHHAQRLGVDAIGVMSWVGPVGVQTEAGHLAVQQAIQKHPDFYWGLQTLDTPRLNPDEIEAQLEPIHTNPHILGLKPYPQFGLPYSDARYDPWWRFAEKHGLYIGIHPYHWYKPEEFESICTRFPDLKVIAYHAGGGFAEADTVIQLANRFPNLYAEPTLTPVWSGIIELLNEQLPANRLMYGSDLPMRDPRQQLGWIVYSRLPEATKQEILGKNASAFLRSLRAGAAATLPHAW